MARLVAALILTASCCRLPGTRSRQHLVAPPFVASGLEMSGPNARHLNGCRYLEVHLDKCGEAGREASATAHPGLERFRDNQSSSSQHLSPLGLNILPVLSSNHNTFRLNSLFCPFCPSVCPFMQLFAEGQSLAKRSTPSLAWSLPVRASATASTTSASV